VAGGFTPRSGQCTHRLETNRLRLISDTLPAVPADKFKHNGKHKYQFNDTFGVETIYRRILNIIRLSVS
jgi:hypothetical protein